MEAEGGSIWLEGSPDARALRHGLARTATQHALFSQALAAQLGVSATDLDCLALLYDLGPATPGQLADSLSLTTGAVTGVVDRLVAAGFVVREDDPADRRRIIVRPLAERAADFDAAQKPLLTAIERSLHSASSADVQRVLDFHEHIAELLQRETARIRRDSSSQGGASGFSAPLGDLTAGALEFASGVAGVRIAALDLSSGSEDALALLYAASFEGLQPAVRVQLGTVSFRYRRIGPFEWGRAKHSGVVQLNTSIPWRIALRGGASAIVVDASGLRLRELKISGGVNKVDVYLPQPSGTVDVCLDGGVSRVQLQRPAGVAAQLQVHGGANRLDFDERRFGAVGGDAVLATPDWDAAADRYAFEIRGGASRLSVQELQEGFPRAHDLW
jgi:DNA-binding MarR family transcriptional regulator